MACEPVGEPFTFAAAHRVGGPAVVERGKHLVDAQRYGGAVVEFETEIVGHLDLAGKDAQHVLEESVDCRHVEECKVGKQFVEHFRCMCGKSVGVGAEQCRELGEVGAYGIGLPRLAVCEHGKLRDDASGHLLRGFVGECDGEDVTVGVLAR